MASPGHQHATTSPLRSALVWVVALVVCGLLLMGQGTTKRTLMEEDAGVRSVLRYGSALTSATLQSAINSLGATPTTLLITPGTWAITANLTFPTTLGVEVADGAVLNISAGVVVTANGGFRGPRQPLVSGSGRLVLGDVTPTVPALWWGQPGLDSTLRNAVASIGTSRKTLTLEPATWTVTSNLTLPTTLTVQPTPGAILNTSAATLTINGPVSCGPTQQCFQPNGSYAFGGTLTGRYPVMWFGSRCDNSTVDNDSFTTLIASLPSTGGILEVPQGTCVLSTALIFDDKRSISLEGAGGVSAGAPTASTLKFTQTTGTSLISLRSTFGTWVRRLRIESAAGYAGVMVDFSHSAGTGLDAALNGIEEVYLLGSSTTTKLIDLNEAHTITIRNSRIDGGLIGIGGATTSYANVLTIDKCYFRNQGDVPIKNFGNGSQMWVLRDNTVEPKADGTAGFFDSISPATSVMVTGNWMGDVPAMGVGTWFRFNACHGCLISANFIAGGSKGIHFYGTANSNHTRITDNVFSNLTTALDLTGSPLWKGDFSNNFVFNTTNTLIGTVTQGRYVNASAGEPFRQKGGLILETGNLTVSSGSTTLDNTVANGVGANISNTMWTILISAAASRGQIIKGAASQSADYVTYQTNVPAILGGVTANGHVYVGPTENGATRLRPTSLVLIEDPSAMAGIANSVVLFSKDNGSGKTSFCLKFPSGTDNCIATEP